MGEEVVRLQLRSGFDLDRLGAIEHRANEGRQANGVSRRVLMWVAHVRLKLYEGRTKQECARMMMITERVRLGANAGERRSECERSGSTWVG
jgi:hypothetical protein